MRVLWISNIEIKDELKSSGSWIYAMANALLSVKDITLGNIVPSKTKKVIRSDFKSLNQWRVPRIGNIFKTVLNKADKKNILDIVTVFNPDIIHIWGTENGYALITPFVNCPVLVEIQGINSEIGRYCFGDLTLRERFSLLLLREILTGDHIFKQMREMLKMKAREEVIFKTNKYFSTPTDWMRANVEARAKNVKYFSTGFILRDEFYNAKVWSLNENRTILTSISHVSPYKGLHILLDALAILKNRFPEIQLHIIGPFLKKGIRAEAYIHFLHRKIKKLGIEDNVVWLGSLNAGEICDQIQKSSVFVNPSFIESAGMTILEAMAAGIPIVSTYTGGIPSFNSDSVLFFAPGDSKMCAFQISRTLVNKDLNLNNIEKSRTYINKYHNKEVVIHDQIQIYKNILQERDSL
jgi:glycosyltransferase involved in cell wall biosynthesis